MLPHCTANFFYYKNVWGHTRARTLRNLGKRLRIFFWLPDCTEGATTLMAASLPSRKPIIFKQYYVLITLLHTLRLRPLSLHTPKSRDSFWQFFPDYQTVREHITRLHGGAGLRICGLLPTFLTTRLYGGNHSNDGCFFPRRKPIILNIIMHLLHSYIHRDLDHSCSILHKSRDLNLSVGREIFPRGGTFPLYISFFSVGNHTYFQIWHRKWRG